MKKILLVCSAGMSTSFLVTKMKKAAQEKNLNVDIEAVAEAASKDYVGKADVVLLGPQIKYLEKKIQEEFKETPVRPINMVDYGTMNGAKVLEFALSLIK